VQINIKLSDLYHDKPSYGGVLSPILPHTLSCKFP
jgi:hypothetical protein